MNKIFVIGLPRTGTTSVCVTLLELGFKVAHTAYTRHSVESADVIADTPAFCDYPQLDQLFPNSRFIYLERSLSSWLPSVKILLQKMHRDLTRVDQGFHPLIRRCYSQVFAPLSSVDDVHLSDCYQRHGQSVHEYFQGREADLLSINVGDPDSYADLLSFLGLPATKGGFPVYNTDGKITAWQKIKHPGKISANAAGEQRRQYFDYVGLSDNA